MAEYNITPVSHESLVASAAKDSYGKENSSKKYKEQTPTFSSVYDRLKPADISFKLNPIYASSRASQGSEKSDIFDFRRRLSYGSDKLTGYRLAA